MIGKAEIEAYAKKRTGRELIAGFDHFSRNYRAAREVARSMDPKFDDDVLHAACFLHDIVLEEPHAKASAAHAAAFLRQGGWPKDKIEAVRHAIAEHTPGSTPKSAEAIALHDADMLDFLGATGFARFAVWSHRWSRHATLRETLELIRQWALTAQHSIISRKGKQIAKGKIKFINAAIGQLEKELG